MALTAKPQSALPPPSWDETIVPALRKRLQDESRVLAKRMSSSSIGASDDSHYDIYDAYADPEYPRPTAIPRPSVSTGRPSISDSNRPPSASSSRSRTLSQPKLHDRSTTTAKANASPPMPRTTSPHANGAIPTRIPVARTRAGSVSSYAATATASPGTPWNESRNGSASGNGNGTGNGYAYHHVSSTPDLQKVAERNLRAQQTQTARESSLDLDPPRASMDSEERPYEHWYRGDVSRNGGVGEYRVGRRHEMLDIANYGHKASPHLQAEPNGWQVWQNGPTQRRRRNSASERPRESFYLDPDATGDSERVLDESPPSGLDSDDARSAEGARQEALYDDDIPSRSTTPTMDNHGGSLTAPFARQTSNLPRTPTPTRSRTAPPQDAPRAPALDASLSAPGSSTRVQTTTPQSQAKGRAKSPATATPPSSKKKAQTPPATQQRKRDEDSRYSVSEYPVLGEEADMSNAIPTWTQPVPTTGNWDDVVLPAVARKKGLDGHYVRADGSPQPKPRGEEIPEPAPGTFGYDYSKYKPPSAMQPESIPMHEFGQQRRLSSTAEPNDDAGSIAPSPLADTPVSPVDARKARARLWSDPPSSPSPFYQYSLAATANSHHVDEGITTAGIPIDHRVQQQQQVTDDEGGSAGCCKCVVM
ncbi:hypothetical protein K488DRAFT_68601 [Vararia minispora EC-137]|uniref:Uncharacterized protein n=1 Tax=Vararia minispora EC-137 TaxID=1314806 RepID=A0ACB8QV28_9AGAM|nr:hypothetical protein K488DRAFT_68601 [Vararia minispora EC-137]